MFSKNYYKTILGQSNQLIVANVVGKWAVYLSHTHLSHSKHIFQLVPTN